MTGSISELNSNYGKLSKEGESCPMRRRRKMKAVVQAGTRVEKVTWEASISASGASG
jgi:hypothetical protein